MLRLLILLVSVTLVGCGIQNAKQGRLDRDYFDASQEAFAAATSAESAASPIEEGMSKDLSSSAYIKKYLGGPDNKAMYGAFPLTCNYRYYNYRNGSVLGAMARAKDGCQRKMDNYNDLTGTDCQCRIIALGNTLFYDSSVYLGSTPYLPMVGQVVSADGSNIEIKGLVELTDAGASMSTLKLTGPDGQVLCTGSFDIGQKAKGNLQLSCFGGEIQGRGEFVHKAFDPELRVWNGTASIRLGDGSQMLVVYGRDAL